MVEEYGRGWKNLGKGSNRISIRINPGEGHGHSKKTNTGGPYSKHGIWHENLDEVKRIAGTYGLVISGVHMHIGSGGDMEHLKRITSKLVEFAKQFDDLTTINFGGGLPYQYNPDLPQEDISGYKEISSCGTRESRSTRSAFLKSSVLYGRVSSPTIFVLPAMCFLITR